MSLFADAIDTSMGTIMSVMGDPGRVFMPAAGGSFEVSGIFDKAQVIVDVSGDVPVETRKPVLCLQKSELSARGAPQPEQGDVFQIDGTEYEVEQAHDDGYAEVRIILMLRGANPHA